MTDRPPALLADGSAPARPDELLRLLDQLEIEATTHRHPPVFTVEEAQALKGDLPGAHTKNLFLRDKKERMWVVVALHDRDVDLRALGPELGARGRLSFGSERRLMRYLGVRPGSVTPFAVVNDHGGRVSVVLDAGLRAFETWNAHPLDNGMTTALSGTDLVRFLEAVDHPPTWVALD
ncbi:MAG: prolyl-tRNA synthetase associated domain-containing protein [Longimicrobiales bacterium]